MKHEIEFKKQDWASYSIESQHFVMQCLLDSMFALVNLLILLLDSIERWDIEKMTHPWLITKEEEPMNFEEIERELEEIAPEISELEEVTAKTEEVKASKPQTKEEKPEPVKVQPAGRPRAQSHSAMTPEDQAQEFVRLVNTDDIKKFYDITDTERFVFAK